MRRPANDAWFEKQLCGPLFVYFTVYDEGDEVIVVEWHICPDDDDKAEERAHAGSDWDIRGPKDQIEALIDRAMSEARESAISIGNELLEWARSTT